MTDPTSVAAEEALSAINAAGTTAPPGLIWYSPCGYQWRDLFVTSAPIPRCPQCQSTTWSTVPFDAGRSLTESEGVPASDGLDDWTRLAEAWANVMDGRRIGDGLNAARIGRDTTRADDWRAIAAEYRRLASSTTTEAGEEPSDRIEIAACEALGAAIEETPWPPQPTDSIAENRTGHGAVIAADLFRRGYVVRAAVRPVEREGLTYAIKVGGNFGDWVDFAVGGAIVAGVAEYGIKPLRLLLSHQLYVKTAREWLAEYPAARGIAVLHVAGEWTEIPRSFFDDGSAQPTPGEARP